MDRKTHISESLQALKRALALTGSFANLSRLSGISKMTLLKIGKGINKPTIATKLRLQNFVEQNETRSGRPFKRSEF
ncbi:MAG: hypothetical protein V4591_03345 [Bdellovibrionota bacterium]